MAMVNCNKCDYTFDDSEKFCPRCNALYVKDAYVKQGPVEGLPYAEKPSKASQPAAINMPKFKPTKERHNYGPKPDELPKPRNPYSKVSTELPEYKKSNSGKILGLLVIVIILVAVYYIFVK